MKIASVGLEFHEQGGITTLDLESGQSLLDFDVAIFNLPGIQQELLASNLNLRLLDSKKVEIIKMLKLRRSVFVLMCPFQMSLLFPIGNNIQFPICDQATGRRIDFHGHGALKIFWDAIKDFAIYQTQWHDDSLGKPFLNVSGFENDVVGSWFPCGEGNLFFLPTVYFGRNTFYSDAEGFAVAIRSLVNSLTANATEIQMPEWTMEISWNRLDCLKQELANIRRDLEEIACKEKQISEALASEDLLKILLSTKDHILEDQVIKVLQEIGLKSHPGEPGRCDVILEWINGAIAVAEIKGKAAKSGAEADAAQLTKWVADFHLKNGIQPKGILIVNAFCDMPLNKRKQDAFPNQMLKYCLQQQYCLITTTQLLGIFLEIRQNPGKRAELIESVFQTVGVYSQFSDCKLFLKFNDHSTEDD